MPDSLPILDTTETVKDDGSLRIVQPTPVLSNEQRAYTRQDQTFVDMSVVGRRSDAVRFLQYGVWFLELGKEAGADKDFLIDTAKGLHDAISNLVGVMRRDLDDAYLPTDRADIDMDELDAIIAEIEA